LKVEYGKLLFVGPHPDDVELGCGGTISRWKNSADIMVVVLSPCNDEPKNHNILNEAKTACNTLGVNNLLLETLPRRTFHNDRQKIREILIRVKDDFEPTMVFCPSLHDTHQDHSVAAEETLRLFKDVGLACYESPRSSMNFTPNMYVSLSDADVKRKIDALGSYKSQFDRFYFKANVVQAFLEMRGCQCRTRYAEAFEVMRIKM